MFANYHRNQMEESTIDQRPAKGTRCTHTHVRRRRMDDSCGVRIRQIRTGQTGCHLRTASKSQTKPNASTLSLVFGPEKLGNIQSCRRLFYDFRGRQRRARLGPPNRRRRPAGDAEHQLKPDGPPSTLLQTSASRPPGPFHSFPDATLGAGQKSQRRRFFFLPSDVQPSQQHQRLPPAEAADMRSHSKPNDLLQSFLQSNDLDRAFIRQILRMQMRAAKKGGKMLKFDVSKRGIVWLGPAVGGIFESHLVC